MLGQTQSAATRSTSVRFIVLSISAVLALSACTTTGFDGSNTALNEQSTTDPQIDLGQQEGLIVLPVVTVASVDVDNQHVTFSGYVQGVTEEGGTCHYMVSNDSTTVEADSAGIADRSTTACELLQIDIEKFQRGKWSVKLEYHAVDGTVATSQSLGLEIP